MDLHDARPGDAIELPEGIYTLAALTHCRAAGLAWLVWELAPEQGAPVLLALIDDGVYRAKLDAAEALPNEPELTVEHMIYRLREQGEARGERSTHDGEHDFWLGQYRYYDRGDRALIFMDVHGRIQRLAAEPMDAQLVRIYQ